MNTSLGSSLLNYQVKYTKLLSVQNRLNTKMRIVHLFCFSTIETLRALDAIAPFGILMMKKLKRVL